MGRNPGSMSSDFNLDAAIGDPRSPGDGDRDNCGMELVPLDPANLSPAALAVAGAERVNRITQHRARRRS